MPSWIPSSWELKNTSIKSFLFLLKRRFIGVSCFLNFWLADSTASSTFVLVSRFATSLERLRWVGFRLLAWSNGSFTLRIGLAWKVTLQFCRGRWGHPEGVWDVWDVWDGNTVFFESCWDDDGCWNLPKFIEPKNRWWSHPKRLGVNSNYPWLLGIIKLPVQEIPGFSWETIMCSFCFGFNFNFNFNKIKWNIFTVAPGFYSILFFLKSTIPPRKFSGLMFTHGCSWNFWVLWMWITNGHLDAHIMDHLKISQRHFPEPRWIPFSSTRWGMLSTGNLRVCRNPTLPRKG